MDLALKEDLVAEEAEQSEGLVSGKRSKLGKLHF